MKKFIIVAVAIAGVIMLCGCSANQNSSAVVSKSKQDTTVKATSPTEEYPQVINPITNYDELKQMQETADFTLKFPTEKPSTYTDPTYYSVDEQVYRARYTNENGSEILISVSKIVEDPSGDYTVYDTEKTVQVNNIAVVCKTKDGDAEGAVYLAAFTNSDGIHYTINGATMPELEILIKST